jgi:hypothetical protein
MNRNTNPIKSTLRGFDQSNQFFPWRSTIHGIFSGTPINNLRSGLCHEGLIMQMMQREI